MRTTFPVRLGLLFLGTILAFNSVSLALAQSSTDGNFRRPRLVVSGAGESVRLTSLSIHTVIQGGFAETSLEMIFYNPNPRILEGELEFPLTPGQEISGLALDINGKLRQGVAVEKARGQEMFDDISRRKVDPALLQATAGNSYKLRVYPLPARGQRRVVVRVMEPLALEKDLYQYSVPFMEPLTLEKGLYHYRLPLGLADHLESLALEVEVASPAGLATASAGALGLSLEKSGTFYRGRVEQKNITPAGWLDITVPAPTAQAPEATAALWHNTMYFSLTTKVEVPDKDRPLPEVVTLVWDASSSRAEGNLALEFELLDSYFKKFETGQARLIVVRDIAEKPQTFEIKNGDWQPLRQAIYDLVYDGATNLGGWAFTPDCREYLIFSDGLANYGPKAGAPDFPTPGPEHNVVAINSSSAANYNFLRTISRGQVVDLAHQSLPTAQSRLLKEGARVKVLTEALAGGGETMLEPESAYLSPNQGQGHLVRVAGWAKPDALKEVPIEVTFSDGRVKKILLPLPSRADLVKYDEEAPLTARLWGRYALAELDTNYRVNRRAITRLAQSLGLISRETSLIVLETPEDYARYGVTPPAELKAAVAALGDRKAPMAGEALLDETALANVWQHKVRWWDEDFNQAQIQTKAPARQNQFESEGMYTGEKISLVCINEDIHKVIRQLASVSGKNVVISDAVQGQVNLKLTDVPWDQALDLILSSHNLGVEESDNVLVIYDLPTLQSIQVGRQRVAAERATADSAPSELQVGVLSKEDSLLLNSNIHSSETSSEARTIAAPRIMAANDKTVSIKQGTMIPYKSGSSATTAANVQFKDSGRLIFKNQLMAQPQMANEASQDSGDNLALAGKLEQSQLMAGGAALGVVYEKGGDVEKSPAIVRKKANDAKIKNRANEAAIEAKIKALSRSDNDMSGNNIGQSSDIWSDNLPAAQRIKDSQANDLYAIYLDERPAYRQSSGFYFYVADKLLQQGQTELGLRVLSNLAEMELENRQLLRSLAYRLMVAEQYALAEFILEKVREMAPYEPQSLRDLALVKGALGRPQEAVTLLSEVARRQWPDRFGDINTIALTELNNLITAHPDQVNLDELDPRIVNNLSADLRVVLAWDTDNTDLDLKITGPDETTNKDKYNRNRWDRGNRFSRNCPQGYGPEEFMLKKAQPGSYRVAVKFSNDSRQNLGGEVTALVTLFSNYGKPDQKQLRRVVRLKGRGSEGFVAQFLVRPPLPEAKILKKTYSGEKISLDYTKADLRQVLEHISQISGQAIRVPDDIQGQVTLKLMEVPWDQALDAVLSSQNLALTGEGQQLTVVKRPAPPAASNPSLSQALGKSVFTPKYKTPKKIAEELAKLQTKRGKLMGIDRDIYVEDELWALENIERAFQRLDKPGGNVYLETSLVEVSPHVLNQMTQVLSVNRSTGAKGSQGYGQAEALRRLNDTVNHHENNATPKDNGLALVKFMGLGNLTAEDSSLILYRSKFDPKNNVHWLAARVGPADNQRLQSLIKKAEGLQQARFWATTSTQAQYGEDLILKPKSQMEKLWEKQYKKETVVILDDLSPAFRIWAEDLNSIKIKTEDEAHESVDLNLRFGRNCQPESSRWLEEVSEGLVTARNNETLVLIGMIEAGRFQPLPDLTCPPQPDPNIIRLLFITPTITP